MKKPVKFSPVLCKPLLLSLMLMLAACLNAQRSSGQYRFAPKLTIGVHADPAICWFGSDIDEVSNDGARPGFNIGINLYRYFRQNYAVSTGLSLISTSGRLVTSEPITFDITSGVDPLVPGNTAITYNIQYLSIPAGLKLQTNQIGYITYFCDIGLDPKVAVSKKVDIADLTNQKAHGEINTFNLSYHLMAGIEYALGGRTAFVLGLGFENNFIDMTKDNKQAPFNQPADKISYRILSMRFGVNF